MPADKTHATPADTPYDPTSAPTRPSGDAPVAAAQVMPTPDTGSLTDDENRYVERGMLGHGGMGEVHCFHDRRIGRDVAKKTLLDELSNDPAARRRFVREARLQGQIEHPAVVPVYDLEVEPSGALSFTMKRVSGRTLREILATGDPATRLSRRKLLTGLAHICLALDCAHARGIVHRDLKPANLMFGELGEVYVLDWGVARAPGDSLDLDAGLHAHSTETGMVGTPQYMAPEQVTGAVDARTDVYAMGLVLYEVLAGKPLRSSASPLHVLRDAAREDPRPSVVNPDVAPSSTPSACGPRQRGPKIAIRPPARWPTPSRRISTATATSSADARWPASTPRAPRASPKRAITTARRQP